MKLRELCELTGLTDRAVRYYIENGLVFPETGENYTGRRSFDFSDADADRLRQIAIFRKAGFGIEEIKGIFAGTDVRGAVRERIDQINAEREILKSLIDAEWTEELTAAELSRVLEAPADVGAIPQEDSDPPFPRIIRKARRIIAGLCVGVCVMLVLVGFHNDNNWHNPHIEIEIVTEGDTVTVRQSVAYCSDDDIITGAIKETTVPAGTSRISVVMEGLLG